MQSIVFRDAEVLTIKKLIAGESITDEERNALAKSVMHPFHWMMKEVEQVKDKEIESD